MADETNLQVTTYYVSTMLNKKKVLTQIIHFNNTMNLTSQIKPIKVLKKKHQQQKATSATPRKKF